MKYPVSARILSGILWLLMAVDLYYIVTMPFTYETYYLHYYWSYDHAEMQKTALMIFLMLFGIMGLWIMAELQLLLRSIRRDPFVMTTVFGLRRIGTAAVITSALLLGKYLFTPTLLTILTLFILLIASLFCFTLAALFRQAAIYKQEIDLTI